MRKLLFLVCILGSPCASLAQPNQAIWTNLSLLRPGQTIQVIDAASKKHSGTFASVPDTEISYRKSSGEQTV